MRRLTFYFDIVSPYSAFAWVALLRLRPKWDLQLEIKPFFLGGIMKGSGNQPPAMLPNRAMFVAQDVARNAVLYDLAILATPANFFSSVARDVLKVQRTLAGRVFDGAEPAELEALVSAFFHAIHADPANRNAQNELIMDDAFMLATLGRAGLTPSQTSSALQRSQSAEAKQLLTDNTNEALELGAYGSPTMLIHFGQPFEETGKPWLVFGSDRFEQIAKMARLPYPGVGVSKL